CSGGGFVNRIVPAVGSPALIAVPLVLLMKTAGIVIVASVPPIVKIESPALFAMIAPTAPAFCAFLTLTTKAQAPRSARTILPAALPLGSASQASLVVPTP